MNDSYRKKKNKEIETSSTQHGKSFEYFIPKFWLCHLHVSKSCEAETKKFRSDICHCLYFFCWLCYCYLVYSFNRGERFWSDWTMQLDSVQNDCLVYASVSIISCHFNTISLYMYTKYEEIRATSQAFHRYIDMSLTWELSEWTKTKAKYRAEKKSECKTQSKI